MQIPITIAILDDYQNVALSMADWSGLRDRAILTVFNDHVADPDVLVERLRPFEILCVMRERTPLPGAVLERLPRLKLIVSTGARNASIDTEAAGRLGIAVRYTASNSAPAIELTWALILASVRHIKAETAALRTGGWQRTVGSDLEGRTLGVVGLGKIGAQVARIGQAFGMSVIAWSQNLTAERAADVGARLVGKDELFREADIITLHLVLSARTKGLVSARELALMKPTARLVNTSRGPLVVEADLIDALTRGTIAGAALDVFDIEPLPPFHPFRHIETLLATPHIGYVSEGVYRMFYEQTVAAIEDWLGV